MEAHFVNKSTSMATRSTNSSSMEIETDVFLFYGYEMERFLSPEAFNMILSVALITAECVCFVGVATNIINIIVFVKLGLRETTSISMMSLAVSDLLMSVISLWSNLLYIPPFRNLDLPFRAEDIFLLTGGITRYFLSRTSALITMYIALERCLCVIFPLKIKSIITRKRTIIVMVTIFASTLGPYVYVYFNYRFQTRYYPDVNRTLLGVIYINTVLNNVVDKVMSLLVGTTFALVAFLITFVATLYLIIHLSRASRWRLGHSGTKTTAGALSEQNAESEKQAKKKEKTDRVARTVVAIAVVFILCFLPGVLAITLYVFVPGFSLYGKYGQIFQLFQSFALFLEIINSSVNLFIYISMGTSFRVMFKQIFGLNRKD